MCTFCKKNNMKLGTHVDINNVSNIDYRTTSTDHRATVAPHNSATLWCICLEGYALWMCMQLSYFCYTNCLIAVSILEKYVCMVCRGYHEPDYMVYTFIGGTTGHGGDFILSCRFSAIIIICFLFSQKKKKKKLSDQRSLYMSAKFAAVFNHSISITTMLL